MTEMEERNCQMTLVIPHSHAAHKIIDPIKIDRRNCFEKEKLIKLREVNKSTHNFEARHVR